MAIVNEANQENIPGANQENIPPGNTGNEEEYVVLNPVDSSFEESTSTTSSSNSIHGTFISWSLSNTVQHTSVVYFLPGTSRVRERRRSRRSASGPYQENFEKLLAFMKESEERCSRELEAQRQRDIAESEAQRQHEREMTSTILSALNSIANALVSRDDAQK